MRWRAIIFLTMLCATLATPEIAQAQLSPQGIFHSLTRPFRQMLGHVGPRHHAPRRHATSADASADKEADKPSLLGMVGPPAWPTAYEDVLGYVFWPDDYAPELRDRGFSVIADTITGQFDIPRARVATTGAANAADPCKETTDTRQDWPGAQIEQALQLSDEQKKALAPLQARIVESVKAIKAGCHDEALAPADRLRALVHAFWTVRDAGVMLSGPLQDFTATLTDEQKSVFVTLPSDKPEAVSKKTAQACAGPNVASAERMVKIIEKRVKPNKDQAKSLETLHKASAEMAKLLMPACLAAVPTDPSERLDGAVNQLTTMIYAATTMQIALNDFYGTLNDKQKERLDR